MKCFALLALAMIVDLVTAPPLHAADRTVTILHVSDTHGHLEGTGPRDARLAPTQGGIARVTTLLAAERRRDPHALVLHAGDAFQGDLLFNTTFGVPEMAWIAATGFDAITAGNHEFDLGPDTLAGILATAFEGRAVPLLSANAGNLASMGLDPFVRRSLLKDAGGVKVGIVGLTVPDDPMCQNGVVTLDPDVATVTAREIAALRAAGAEVVLVLSHLGLAGDVALASAVDGIDAILGGHDHVLLERPEEVLSPSGRSVPIVHSGAYYAHVGRLRLQRTATGTRVLDWDLLPVDEDVRPDPEVAAQVEAWKAALEVSPLGPVFSRSVGAAPRNLPVLPGEKSPWKDTPTGNLVTDAFRAAGRTELALTTAGFLAEGLPRGPLVPADLFHVVSYGFDPATGLGFGLYTCEISGAELAKALETAVAGAGPADPFFPHVAGVRFAYDSSHPVGQRVALDSIRVGRGALDPGRTYTMTLNGAAAMFLPLLGVEVSNVAPIEGSFEFTALLQHVERLGGLVAPRAEGRVLDLARPRSWGGPGPVLTVRRPQEGGPS